MSCYASLARWYDSLTGDVPYAAFADYYEGLFRADGGEFRLLLDLCCGTGTLTWEMAARGYETIGADRSSEMLSEAFGKQLAVETRPLFLCQSAEELDLYGTVDAAYCSLDGMNYLPPESLPEVFRRLRLFIRPGGLLIFDLRTPEFLRALSGQVFVDEKEDLLCLWRADFDEEAAALVYGMDLFTRRGKLWAREGEEHVEYAHGEETIRALLTEAGFAEIAFRPNGPQSDQGRQFITAKRGE